MSAMASQITRVLVVCTAVCWGEDQRHRFWCHNANFTVPSMTTKLSIWRSFVFSGVNQYTIKKNCRHYSGVIMGAMASQITSLTIVYSTIYSGVDQRKHQSSASLAFVRAIHRWPMDSPHRGPVTRKRFPFDDVIMYRYCPFPSGLFHWLWNNSQISPVTVEQPWRTWLNKLREPTKNS